MEHVHSKFEIKERKDKEILIPGIPLRKFFQGIRI